MSPAPTGGGGSGYYGGGGGGANYGGSLGGGVGGVVRILWPATGAITRSYPSTNTGNL